MITSDHYNKNLIKMIWKYLSSVGGGFLELNAQLEVELDAFHWSGSYHPPFAVSLLINERKVLKSGKWQFDILNFVWENW